jgi:hypothetical protein
LGVNSEINHIKEIFHEISTELCIQGHKDNKTKTNHLLLRLLDTGATSVFVKKAALQHIDHQIKKINVQVKGQHAITQLKEIAIFSVKLPDFYKSRSISIQAYVEEKTVGRHDIILGIRFIQQLGLTFDFKRHTVSWDEKVIPMRQTGSSMPEELTNIDFFHPEAPTIVQKDLKQLERSISQNQYDTHNYQSMILKCTHLDSSQQDKLPELFCAYASLFDGSLGKVPNIKVHLDLKPNSKPFCARAYKI